MKGYVPKGNPFGDFLGNAGAYISDVYRDTVDNYNATIDRLQRYIRNDPMESYEDFKYYSLWSAFGLPQRPSEDILTYMDRYGISWDKVKFYKAFGILGSSPSSGVSAARRSLNYVSRNVERLYR